MPTRLSALAMAAGVMGLGMAVAAEPQKGPSPVDVKRKGHREGGMVGTLTVSGPPPFQTPPGR